MIDTGLGFYGDVTDGLTGSGSPIGELGGTSTMSAFDSQISLELVVGEQAKLLTGGSAFHNLKKDDVVQVDGLFEIGDIGVARVTIILSADCLSGSLNDYVFTRHLEKI